MCDRCFKKRRIETSSCPLLCYTAFCISAFVSLCEWQAPLLCCVHCLLYLRALSFYVCCLAFSPSLSFLSPLSPFSSSFHPTFVFFSLSRFLFSLPLSFSSSFSFFYAPIVLSLKVYACSLLLSKMTSGEGDARGALCYVAAGSGTRFPLFLTPSPLFSFRRHRAHAWLVGAPSVRMRMRSITRSVPGIRHKKEIVDCSQPGRERFPPTTLTLTLT